MDINHQYYIVVVGNLQINNTLRIAGESIGGGRDISVIICNEFFGFSAIMNQGRNSIFVITYYWLGIELIGLKWLLTGSNNISGNR